MTEDCNPFTGSNQMNLADVLERVHGDSGLDPQRRRNLCSARRGLGRLIGKNPRYLPADPGYYRPFFKRLHPEQCDLSASRIRNIKSDVLFALRHVGCIQGARTYMAPFNEDWQGLWEAASVAGRLRRDVSRLMHFCSAQGIDPLEVDDGVAERLRDAMVEESFIANPVKAWKTILKTWNKLAHAVPAWPSAQLSIPNDRDDYSIPLERFPASLQFEVEALRAYWRGDDILAETGPLKPLSPRTIDSRLYRLRQAASALVLSGWSIGDVDAIAKLVDAEAARTILRFYLDRAGGRPTSQVHGIAVLLKTLAKYWVKVSDQHLDRLRGLCAKVNPQIKGLTEKNRRRLRQFDDMRNVALLLHFPRRRIDEAIKADRGRQRDAVAVQIALAVELLILMPIRAENLANLHLERHIQRSRAGKAGVVHVVIPGNEVKNGEDLEFELPADTVDLLDLYLREFHPRLGSGDSPWLFPGDKGAKTVNTLGEQIKAHVFKATGLQVNLHLFRHIAAKLHLDRNPGAYEVVRRVLGHRSMDTTIKFYAGLETAAAGRHFDEHILKLRDELGNRLVEGT
jgi:integrase